ncbi:hypothetical protein MSG28_010044 [Choristoneura fumiferana]|uniref:Uncharacterized protein n=1 Tax=Choristoneura fumiferana TaxID=7141 RepID=A0ACC0KJR7_CHOFU|nr:hypothetical protein MSG28_010044 [Choristoneura fumiferana]
MECTTNYVSTLVGEAAGCSGPWMTSDLPRCDNYNDMRNLITTYIKAWSTMVLPFFKPRVKGTSSASTADIKTVSKELSQDMDYMKNNLFLKCMHCVRVRRPPASE